MPTVTWARVDPGSPCRRGGSRRGAGPVRTRVRRQTSQPGVPESPGSLFQYFAVSARPLRVVPTSPASSPLYGGVTSWTRTGRSSNSSPTCSMAGSPTSPAGTCVACCGDWRSTMPASACAASCTATTWTCYDAGCATRTRGGDLRANSTGALMSLLLIFPLALAPPRGLDDRAQRAPPEQPRWQVPGACRRCWRRPSMPSTPQPTQPRPDRRRSRDTHTFRLARRRRTQLGEPASGCSFGGNAKFWDPADIDFTRDRADWDLRLSDDERDYATRLLHPVRARTKNEPRLAGT